MRDLVTIAKVELKKLLSRKDTWLMFTILLVPILYSVGLAFESNVITYTGSGSVTAIGFTSAMFQMSQSMFIFNVILSAIIGRSFASEIESKSLRLCINRIGDRRLIYLGKELALLLYSAFIDVLLIATSIICYYAVLTRNPNVANGVFCDNRMGTEIAQILSVSIFWFITIFIVMLMATKLKTLVCVAAYMIFYIIMNLLSFLNGIKYFSPLYYLVEISSESSSTLLDVTLFIVYLFCIGICLTYIGVHRLEKMDL